MPTPRLVKTLTAIAALTITLVSPAVASVDVTLVCPPSIPPATPGGRAIDPAATTPPPHTVQGEDFEGVILTGAAAVAVVDWLFFGEDGVAWTPAAADVIALEAGVERFLCTPPSPPTGRWSPDLWERIEDYKRQYAGVEVDGRRLVLANFFCAGFDDDDWLTEPVLVDDGGDCFFSLTYDVESSTYGNLRINGEA